MDTYPKIQQLTFKGLGTEIDLQIVVNSSEQFELSRQQLVEIKSFYARIENIFSRFDPDSELSRLNENMGAFSKASAEMLEIFQKALFYYKETGGLFDPRILRHLEASGYDKDFDSLDRSGNFIADAPEKIDGKNLETDLLVEGDKLNFKKRMDFSGIVKGWVTDTASKKISDFGWKNFLVDSGGDIYFAGFGQDGKKWRVDVEGVAKEKFMLELSDLAVATSGIGKRKWERSGKRFHHLINPKNPSQYSFDVSSVTVVAENTEQADVWAKTLFILGKEEAKKKAKEKGLACVILEYGGRAWISPAIKQYLFTQ